jgi:hypothetical protein
MKLSYYLWPLEKIQKKHVNFDSFYLNGYPLSQHLQCCTLWSASLISVMIGHHRRLVGPFALTTCSKYVELFSKNILGAPQKKGTLKPSIAAPEIVAREKYLHRLHRKWSSLQLISILKQKSSSINTLIIESQWNVTQSVPRNFEKNASHYMYCLCLYRTSSPVNKIIGPCMYLYSSCECYSSQGPIIFYRIGSSHVHSSGFAVNSYRADKLQTTNHTNLYVCKNVEKPFL